MENLDQAQAPVETTESPSAEVLALLAQDQAVEPTVDEKVGTETDTVTSDANEEGEAKPDEGTEAESTTEEKPDEKQEKPKEEDTTKEPEKKVSQEFIVAGITYSNFDEAAKAVTRISGDNTRLAGDVITLKQQLSTKDEEITTLSKKVEEWQRFYDNDETGEKPQTNTESVDDKVKKVLAAERQAEVESARKVQFAQELTDISKEPDYAQVVPHMQKLAEELGDGLHKISPKKLYSIARGLARDTESTKVLDTAKELAEENAKKQLNKDKARMVLGGNAKKSPSIMPEPEVSPEVAALL